MRVLVVDDHEEVLDVVARALGKDGHVVRVAGSAGAARDALADEDADLIVLDLGLPDQSGVELCKELRARGQAAPILVLTAQHSVSSRVQSLDSGADDYLMKPFAVAELRARVRALGRRTPRSRAFVLSRGDVHIDFSARRATVGGEPAPVTAREWAILDVLAARPGAVVSRIALLDGVWGGAAESAGASLEVLVARIRKKLGASLVRTVRGEGYALADD
jgi:DNA-binding response OmpR family regulator